MATGGDNVIGSDFDYSTVEINEVGFINSIEKNKDESIFDSAELKQMDVMEDFSKWLLSNGWEFHYSKKIWINHENSNQYLFNEVFQIFLEETQ
jgi:hypothetical protein